MSGIGRTGEDLAARHLEAKGYTIIARNWRGVKGNRAPEIDIIASKEGTVAFVEVKSTKSQKFGPPEYRITSVKRRRLVLGAQAFLLYGGETTSGLSREPRDYRFDAVIVNMKTRPVTVTHIENAFLVSDDPLQENQDS